MLQERKLEKEAEFKLKNVLQKMHATNEEQNLASGRAKQPTNNPLSEYYNA